jgi:hypothetical protein
MPTCGGKQHGVYDVHTASCLVLYRWVKFEERVDLGGNRWSKPHVPTPAVHALESLREMIAHAPFVQLAATPDSLTPAFVFGG